MIRTFALAVLFGLMLSAPAAAQRPNDFAAAITDESVAVTSDYRGARLTVFGVHWRHIRGRNDVVVVLRGPPATEIVHRKRRIFGFWVNADPVRFKEAPSFFALVSTRPVSSFLDPAEIWGLGLDPGALARLDSATPSDSDPAAYRRAFVRLRKKAGLVRESPRGLVVEQDGAFKVPFIIPANAPIGTYKVDVLLFRNGRLVKRDPSEVIVARIGIEKTIFNAAQERPALYGLAAVIFSLVAGWFAAIVFRRD